MKSSLMVYSLFTILLILAAIAGLVVLIIVLVKSSSQPKNPGYPQIITLRAVVSLKRNDNSFLVTFNLENGRWIELYVPENEFEKLTEGESGRLTFQGNMYLGFEK